MGGANSQYSTVYFFDFAPGTGISCKCSVYRNKMKSEKMAVIFLLLLISRPKKFNKLRPYIYIQWS